MNGVNSFYLLSEEFVNTTLLKNNNLNDFMEELRRNEGVWVEMTSYLKEIYHKVALKEDRESVIRRHGTYQKLRINYEKNGSKEQIYGIITLDGEEILCDKLSYEECKNRHLQKEVEVLRKNGKNNAWITLAHGNSKNAANVDYNTSWPRITFQQGNKNTCLQRSMSSVLMYLRKSRNITDGFINEIIQELNNKRIYDTAKNKEKMHIVLQYSPIL